LLLWTETWLPFILLQYHQDNNYKNPLVHECARNRCESFQWHYPKLDLFLIQQSHDFSCGSRNVWLLCIFPIWNRHVSPDQQHRLVPLTSMVIYDKRTTSVVLAAIINCHTFIVEFQPLLRMKSIFYNSYVALELAVCIQTFCNGTVL